MCVVFFNALMLPRYNTCISCKSQMKGGLYSGMWHSHFLSAGPWQKACISNALTHLGVWVWVTTHLSFPLTPFLAVWECARNLPWKPSSSSELRIWSHSFFFWWRFIHLQLNIHFSHVEVKILTGCVQLKMYLYPPLKSNPFELLLPKF